MPHQREMAGRVKDGCVARDGPNAQPASGRMLDFEACLATKSATAASASAVTDRPSRNLACAASDAFQQDKAVDRRRSLRVVPSNKGEALTGSRDDFSGKHRDVWPLCSHCRRQTLNITDRDEGLARMCE